MVTWNMSVGLMIENAATLIDPESVIPDRSVQCLVSLESAIPASGSRVDLAHDRIWVEFGRAALVHRQHEGS